MGWKPNYGITIPAPCQPNIQSSLNLHIQSPPLYSLLAIPYCLCLLAIFPPPILHRPMSHPPLEYVSAFFPEHSGQPSRLPSGRLAPEDQPGEDARGRPADARPWSWILFQRCEALQMSRRNPGIPTGFRRKAQGWRGTELPWERECRADFQPQRGCVLTAGWHGPQRPTRAGGPP